MLPGCCASERSISPDLNGFSGDGRPAIFTHRAAPVQISWLAYPGTMGMQSMDLHVADRHVIPPACERFIPRA